MSRWFMIVDIEPVVDPSVTLTRLTPEIRPGTTDVAYRGIVKGEGGTEPYTYAALSGLPAWATLDPSSGEISGTPTGGPAFNEVTIEVTDANAVTFTMTTSLEVFDSILITGVLSPIEEGIAYSSGLGTSGATGAVTWGLTGSIPGLSIDTGTGLISGTPTTPGDYAIEISATDSLGLTTTVSLEVTVFETFTMFPFAAYNQMPAGMVGAVYEYQPTVSGGVSPFLYEIVVGAADVAAAGLSFDPNTGRIYGTPTTATVAATEPVEIQGTDLLGATDTIFTALGINEVSFNPAVHWAGTFDGDGSSVGFFPTIDIDMLVASVEVYEVIGGIDYKMSVDYNIDQTTNPPVLYIGDFTVPPSIGQTFRVIATGGSRP